MTIAAQGPMVRPSEASEDEIHPQHGCLPPPGTTPGVLASLEAIERRRQQQQLAEARPASCWSFLTAVPWARISTGLLYFWSSVLIVLTLALPCLGVFLLYFKDGGFLAPIQPYRLASYTSVALSFVAGLGLYGLHQQRQCVTDGRRNYALATFVVLGFVGAAILFVSGAVALAFADVVALAQQKDFVQERVVLFETVAIENLRATLDRSASGWRQTQNRLSCCGYESVASLKNHASASPGVSWQTSTLEVVSRADGIGGRFCATEVSDCAAGDTKLPCPEMGHSWCRGTLLRQIRANYSLFGSCAVVLGVAQLLAASLAVFTLRYDIRRMHTRSPVIEIEHRTLSPIQLASVAP